MKEIDATPIADTFVCQKCFKEMKLISGSDWIIIQSHSPLCRDCLQLNFEEDKKRWQKKPI